jgi:hypothetical protein
MKTTPRVLDRLLFATVGPRDWISNLFSWRYSTFLWGFSMMQPRLMAKSGELRSRRALYRAAKRVPAYALHLLQSPGGGLEFPETDKESYIKAHAPEARCRFGRLPMARTMILDSAVEGAFYAPAGAISGPSWGRVSRTTFNCGAVVLIHS